VVNPGTTDRERALAGVEEAFAGFATRSSLPRVRARVAAAAAAGVDPSAYPMLAWVEACGPARTTVLAEQVGLDVSTVSRKITDLEDAGFVARRADAEDRRAHLLEITPEGRRAIARIRGARRALLDQALASWSAAEIQALADTLARFTSALADVL